MMGRRLAPGHGPEAGHSVNTVIHRTGEPCDSGPLSFAQVLVVRGNIAGIQWGGGGAVRDGGGARGTGSVPDNTTDVRPQVQAMMMHGDRAETGGYPES